MRIPAFWDASALVPLCVRQAITDEAVALYRSHEIFAWWATSVEIASSLARLRRSKDLTSDEFFRALGRADELAESWSEIEPSDRLRSSAVRLLDQYDLRAADSLQLAAALVWSGISTSGVVFLGADRKLHTAATALGFESRLLGPNVTVA